MLLLFDNLMLGKYHFVYVNLSLGKNMLQHVFFALL